jgi:hypothetical protein
MGLCCTATTETIQSLSLSTVHNEAFLQFIYFIYHNSHRTFLSFRHSNKVSNHITPPGMTDVEAQREVGAQGSKTRTVVMRRAKTEGTSTNAGLLHRNTTNNR